MSLARASSIVFIASYASLVVEILAGRMLAPHLGVSLYTWTSIIGVVLSGIAAGGYIGGVMADRWPHGRLLGITLMLSGLAVLLMPHLLTYAVSIICPMSLMTRVVVVAAIVYFVPSCLLGMVTPMVVKKTVEEIHRAGRTVGVLYATAAAGSLAGVFSAGFLLISWLGTRMAVFIVGIVLICCALFSASLFRTRRMAVAFALSLCAVLSYSHERLLAYPVAGDVVFMKESDYFTIKIVDMPSSGGERRVRGLILDNLLHSYVEPDDPLHVEYGYERVYAEVLAWRRGPDERFRALAIGGGGYTMPRYIEAVYPHAEIDVVEIDPMVLRVAHDHLGLPLDTRVRTFIVDGRIFVSRSGSDYDLIFLDVFNDLSLPYHLTTREFAAEMERILSDRGMLLTNIVDDFRRGVFLPSYVRTLQDVFGEGRVHLIAIHSNLDSIGISQFVVVASKSALSLEDFEVFLRKSRPSHTSAIVPPAVLGELSRRPGSIILRDDHAPVDNLIAPVFEERFGYSRR